MNNLEKYLNSVNSKYIYSNDIYYSKFGYQCELLFKHHLQFLLENFYDFKIIEGKKKRLNQKEFRKALLNKYSKCIVSGSECEAQLEASHIVPISEKDNYDIDNGLILTRNLHTTFDLYYWSINPKSMIIEVNPNINVGDIEKYKGTRINIQLNSVLSDNLKKHYKKFLHKHK